MPREAGVMAIVEHNQVPDTTRETNVREAGVRHDVSQAPSIPLSNSTSTTETKTELVEAAQMSEERLEAFALTNPTNLSISSCVFALSG